MAEVHIAQRTVSESTVDNPYFIFLFHPGHSASGCQTRRASRFFSKRVRASKKCQLHRWGKFLFLIAVETIKKRKLSFQGWWRFLHWIDDVQEKPSQTGQSYTFLALISTKLPGGVERLFRSVNVKRFAVVE